MLSLVKKHLELFVLCFTCMFFVGYGQTYFVSQYIPFIREDLNLSRSEISFIYSAATLLASFNLPYLGKLLDKYSQRRFFLVTSILLCAGLTTLAGAASTITLFIGFYLLRGFGQVPLSLLATTIISRNFGQNRGKFLTIAGLGRPISEGIIPFVSISLITAIGWRGSLYSFVAIFFVIMLPIGMFLISKIPTSPLYPENESVHQEDTNMTWTWKIAFQKKWPIFIMITNALLPFIVTGLFFQQDAIASFKGWNLEVMSLSFMALSISNVAGNLFWGPLIDKVTAIRVLPIGLVPLAIGLTCLVLIDSELAVYIYMACIGLSVGATGLVRNSLWAEIYGIKHLGAIKGLDSNIIVVGTAFAPLIYAWLLDNGVNAHELLYGLIGLTLIGIINMQIIYRKFR